MTDKTREDFAKTNKSCPTCGDDGNKWVGRSGGLIVGDEGKPTVQCQACGTHATETTWNAPRAYERQIAALEAEVLALRRLARLPPVAPSQSVLVQTISRNLHMTPATCKETGGF